MLKPPLCIEVELFCSNEKDLLRLLSLEEAQGCLINACEHLKSEHKEDEAVTFSVLYRVWTRVTGHKPKHRLLWALNSRKHFVTAQMVEGGLAQDAQMLSNLLLGNLQTSHGHDQPCLDSPAWVGVGPDEFREENLTFWEQIFISRSVTGWSAMTNFLPGNSVQQCCDLQGKGMQHLAGLAHDWSLPQAVDLQVSLERAPGSPFAAQMSL